MRGRTAGQHTEQQEAPSDNKGDRQLYAVIHSPLSFTPKSTFVVTYGIPSRVQYCLTWSTSLIVPLTPGVIWLIAALVSVILFTAHSAILRSFLLYTFWIMENVLLDPSSQWFTSSYFTPLARVWHSLSVHFHRPLDLLSFLLTPANVLLVISLNTCLFQEWIVRTMTQRKPSWFSRLPTFLGIWTMRSDVGWRSEYTFRCRHVSRKMGYCLTLCGLNHLSSVIKSDINYLTLEIDSGNT